MENILTAKTSTTRNLYIEHINDDYVYFESHVCETDGVNKSHSTVSGITLYKNAINTTGMNPVDTYIPIEWMYKGYGAVIAIPNELFSDILYGRKYISEIYNNRYTGTYDPDNYTYCITNSGSYDLAYLNGEPVPVPVHLNYIHGGITDARYNLNEVLKYIKSNPERFHVSCLSHDEDSNDNNNNEICISDIPYYNADDYTGHKQIVCAYIPTLEDINNLKNIKSFYDRQMYIIEHSGLSKFKLNSY